MGPATDKHQAPIHRFKLYVRANIESIGFLVLEKKLFKGFTISGHGRNLESSSNMNFVFNWLSGFKGEDVEIIGALLAHV